MNFTISAKDNDEKINIFYLLEALCGALAPVFTVLDKGTYTSRLFYASFILVASHFFIHILTKRIYRRGFANLILFVLIVAIAFTSVSIVTHGGMGFNYLKKFIIFCTIFLLIFIASEQKINKSTMKAVIVIFYTLAVFFIIFFFFMGGNRKTNGDRFSTAITMGFSNPNLTGMWLTTVIYFVFFAMGKMKNKFFRLTSIVFIGLLVYMITITESRNSLFSLFLFLVMWLIYKFKRNKKFSALVLLIVLLAPLIFVGVYYSVIDTPFADNLEFLVSEGKELDSRVVIWQKAFNTLKGNHLITGDYYGASNGDGDFQLHNVALDLLASYGVIVYALVIIYLMRMLTHASNYSKDKLNIGMLCFFGVWFIGLGEAGFIVGAAGIYLPVCLLFSFGFYEEKEENEEEALVA